MCIGLNKNGQSNEVLDKLACRAIRQKIPTVARAKNVKGTQGTFKYYVINRGWWMGYAKRLRYNI